MKGAIVWVHGDALSPHNRALIEAPKAPALFVFDEPLLGSYGLSFKRLVFMYESLLELPVTIRKGNVVKELLDYAQVHEAQRILTTDSPSLGFRRIVSKLRESVAVDVLDVPSIVTERDYDLGRFSRYWREAKRDLT